jgi:peroxiredoxin
LDTEDGIVSIRWIVAGAAAAALAFAVVGWPTGSGSLENGSCPPDARDAPLDFVVKDMNGVDVRFADYRGKVVLLNFWATWCGPCKIEIPGFVELQDEYRDQGLAILGFSVDDSPERLQAFAREFAMNYPVLVGDGRDDVSDAFGPFWGIPATVIIDRNGKVCKTHMGFATKSQFERDIKALL